jgi:uncharacterized repeat protein (TIGR01451 family)
MRKHWRLAATLALLALLGGIAGLQQHAALSGPATGPTTVAVVRASGWPVPDAEVEALVRQAVAQAGGLESVIAPGDTVVIKPNLVWGAPPEEGYTTDPRVVRAVVRLAQEAGAGQVIIADGAAEYRDWHDDRGATLEAFRLCGYDANGDMVDDETGVPLVDLNDAGGLDQHDPALVTQVTVPNGLIWTSYWLPRVVMEADVLIGVPVLKNHSAAGVTLALKNQIGIAPSDIYHSPGSQMYKSALHHGPDDLGRHIVDLNLARPLDFVVLDGLRGMTDGPTGGTLIEPPMRLILAGADAVALDTIATLIMGYDPASVPYLSWAAGAGLGTDDVSQIWVNGVRVAQVRRDFPVPYGSPPVQRAEASAPAVHISAPGNGTSVSEQAVVWATASDNDSVAKVEFYVDDELQATVTTPPYQTTLDVSAHRGQMVTLRAVAYDRAMNDAEDTVDVLVVRAPAPGTTAFQTATLAIPTYPYSQCLEIRSDGPYTYPWLDWSCYGSPTPSPRSYTLLVLENDYLRVTLLPELGGRVYQLIYKATGHNELYQNPVIKPTQWGPPLQHWWLAAGGIEWCLPVDEHGYEWGVPWSWDVVTSTAGVTVTVRDTWATDRLRASIDVFLPADRAYLALTPHLENPTAGDLEYKFWLNAALAPGPENRPTAGLQFIFNSEEMAVHSTGDDRLPGHWPEEPEEPEYPFDWPVHDGVDYSYLGNWDEWLGFFEFPHAAADFVGVYSHDAGEGVARVFPSGVVQGTKGFATGWEHPIDWHQWTDDGSGAVELHGGVAPTFWDTAVLHAGETLSWTETWYPFQAIGGLSDATAEAALAVREDGDRFAVGVHSTAARAAGESRLIVWDATTCQELAHWDLPAVDPTAPFLASTPAGGRTLEQITLAYLDAQGNRLAAVNPRDCLPPVSWIEPLPPWVETTTFTVTWSGEDVWEGIAAYDVQVRDGYEGAWTGWLTDTTATSAPFSGADGHTTFFRVRARDVAGNSEDLADDEWGQAFTTILLEPAPVLVTSRKSATSRLILPGQTVGYTILISNTGNLTATAALTDTPPAEMAVLTATLAATSGPPPTYEGDAIHWAGPVPPGTAVSVTYALAPTAGTPQGTPLTNTAEIAGSVLGPLTRRETIVRGYPVWLPTVARGTSTH